MTRKILLNLSLIAVMVLSSCSKPGRETPQVRWITIPETLSMTVDDEPRTITPQYSNAATRNLTWKWESSVEGVVTIDENADKSVVVTPRNAGTTIITVKCPALPSLYDQCTVTVTPSTTPVVIDDDIDGWENVDDGAPDIPKDPDAYEYIFKGRNLVTFGNSITAWSNSWAERINRELEFGNFYNGAVGGAMWLKRSRTANNGQSVTTQDYTDPAFAGFGNQWNSTDPVELQKLVNNAAIVHIQKYLAERDPARSPDFILLAYGTNDPSDTASLGDAQTALQENNPANLDLFTVAGALKWSLVTLRTNFPEAKIYVLLPIQCGKGTTTLVNRFNGNLQKIPVIKAVCDGLGITYFDCWNESGITAENIEQFDNNNDGLHPIGNGQAMHANYVIRKLKEVNRRP